MKKLLGKIFALIGILMILVAVWTGYQQHAILKQWPRVEAEVINSRVAQGPDSEGSMTYKAAIEFRYTVNGKEFSTPASSNISTTNYAGVKRQVDRYPVGSRHLIWHNPADPNDVRFDAGYTVGFFFVPVLFGGMGILFTGIGAAVVMTSRRANADAMSS
jgi:hypothetical protein